MPFRSPLIDLRGAERNRRHLHAVRLEEQTTVNAQTKRSRRSRERKAAKEAGQGR